MRFIEYVYCFSSLFYYFIYATNWYECVECTCCKRHPFSATHISIINTFFNEKKATVNHTRWLNCCYLPYSLQHTHTHTHYVSITHRVFFVIHKNTLDHLEHSWREQSKYRSGKKKKIQANKRKQEMKEDKKNQQKQSQNINWGAHTHSHTHKKIQIIRLDLDIWLLFALHVLFSVCDSGSFVLTRPFRIMCEWHSYVCLKNLLKFARIPIDLVAIDMLLNGHLTTTTTTTSAVRIGINNSLC